jgi:hypothetical protein
MQKLIIRVAWFGRGIRKFEEEVNQHLEQGYRVLGYCIEQHGLRFICHAKLEIDYSGTNNLARSSPTSEVK